MELVLRVVFPPAAAVGVRASAFFTVSDVDQVLKADGASIDWESADAAAVAAEKPNAEVVKAVARLNAAAARQEAVRLNRAGDYGAATQMLRVAHESVQSFAAADESMRGLAEELTAEAVVMSAPTSEVHRKSVHFRGANVARSRDAEGRARRNRQPGSHRKDRPMTTSKPVMIRQGDVLLVPVDEIPTESRRQRRRGRIVLAEGEATGHAHAILERDAETFTTADGSRYLLTKSRAQLIHEEHAPLEVAPGAYRVIIQREYVPPTALGSRSRWRRVAD